MKTYVELKNDDRKFDTIEDAIQEAESQQLDTADIEVYSEDGELRQLPRPTTNTLEVGACKSSDWLL